MKNIEFTSRATDRYILPVFALVGFFVLAAGSGCVLPGISRWQNFSMVRIDILNHAAFINGAISIGLAVFTWSVFKIIRPAYPDRNWQIAEVILIPVIWLLLLAAADLSLSLLVQHSMQELQDIVNAIIQA
ncbi:MAG TPA: hypothetical protein VNV43_08435 [Candidatus Acidoferrales bacterium]|jgi:hypothetical protein|nr:hypothetical protein [Candidatus Acidoferrales bacterium]